MTSYPKILLFVVVVSLTLQGVAEVAISAFLL